jgi:3-deoxy-D-manno-octulosonic-acid transferase
MTNFEDILLRLKEADASIQVLNSEDLLSSIKKLLEDTTYCKNIAAAAKAVAANEAGVLDSVVTELKPFIEHLKNKDSSRANP